MQLFGRPFRPRLWPTLVALSAVLVLLGLGTWQLERLAWKEGLIDDLRSRWSAEPIPLPQDLGDLEGLEYRRVLLTGRFLHERELVLPGKTYKGTYGRWIATPFVLEDGRGVIVNRGWVPEKYADPVTRETGLPEGRVTIEGILRRPGWGGWESMRPDNVPEQNRWYYFDLPAMAEAVGLERAVEAFYVEALGDEASGLLPIGLELEVDLPNDHLQYALTWYALALALVVIYLISQTRRPGGGKGPGDKGPGDKGPGDRGPGGDAPEDGDAPEGSGGSGGRDTGGTGGQRRPAPAARDGPTAGGRPRLLIAEPFCHATTGHGATMARRMREAALSLGFEPKLAVHARCDPALARSLEAAPLFTLPTDDTAAPDWEARREGARRLAAQLAGFAATARPGDTLVLTTAHGFVVPALADWLCGETPGRDDAGAADDRGLPDGVALVVFLFDSREYRLPPDPGQRRYMRGVVARLTALPPARRPSFCAFTEEHAEELQEIFGWPVAALPLPFGTPAQLDAFSEGGLPQDGPPADRGTRILLSPGRQRAEKGAALLTEVAERLQPRLPDWRWRIGGEETAAPQETDAALARFPMVERLPGRLSDEAHLRQLAAADLLLLPYDPARYLGRGSGLLCEAACVGRPLVVPGGCWLGDRIEESDAVGLTFDAWQGTAIADSVAAAAAALPRLRHEAMALAPALRRRHDPVAVLRAALAFAEGRGIPAQRPPIGRMVIVEASLEDARGHFAGLLSLLRQGAEALGLSCRVLLHETAEPSLATALGGEVAFRFPRPQADQEVQPNVEAFSAELERLAAELRPDDLLLFPTLMRMELLALAGWLARRGPPPCRIVLFHHALLPAMLALREGQERPRISAAFEQLRALPDAVRPLIYAFTPELAAETEAIVGLPLLVAELPQAPPSAARVPPPLSADGSGTVATPGAQRPSKGLAIYDALAAGIAERLPGWRWTINGAAARQDQPGDLHMIEGLARHRCVDLLPGPLSDEANRAQLDSAQAILLPYEPESYRTMLSSTLMEAVDAGRPVVVPAGTWMAREVEAGRAAGAIYPRQDPAAILDSLQALLADLPRHAEAAMAIARERASAGEGGGAQALLRRVVADARSPW